MQDNLSNNSSKIRTVSLNLFSNLDKLATKYIKHQSIVWVYSKVVKPRLNHLINTEIPEEDLKHILNDCYNEIKPVVEEFQLAESLKESDKLNDKNMNDTVKKILKADELMDLIE